MLTFLSSGSEDVRHRHLNYGAAHNKSGSAITSFFRLSTSGFPLIVRHICFELFYQPFKTWFGKRGQFYLFACVCGDRSIFRLFVVIVLRFNTFQCCLLFTPRTTTLSKITAIISNVVKFSIRSFTVFSSLFERLCIFNVIESTFPS